MPTGTYASVVVGTTIFSTYDGVSPYPNLAAIHPHPENSLVDDYVNWHVSLHLAGQGEAAWDMGATSRWRRAIRRWCGAAPRTYLHKDYVLNKSKNRYNHLNLSPCDSAMAPGGSSWKAK